MTDAPPPPPPSRRDLMESPVDLPAGPIDGRPLAWTAGTIACATLLLLLTNAVSLDGWAAELPPSERVARLNDATAGWRRATDMAWFGTPRAVMQRAWQSAQRKRFTGQPTAG